MGPVVQFGPGETAEEADDCDTVAHGTLVLQSCGQRVGEGSGTWRREQVFVPRTAVAYRYLPGREWFAASASRSSLSHDAWQHRKQ